MDEECGNCKFWRRSIFGEPAELGSGLCRRYPPKRLADIPIDEDEDMSAAHFSQVMTFDDEWCGEHKFK